MPTPPDSCPSPDELGLLALDAAKRAEVLLSGHRPPDRDPVIDLVRLLHGRKDSAVTDIAAQRAGLSPAALARVRAAYAFGGAEGVRNAHYPADADPTTIDNAVHAIEAIKATPAPHPEPNMIASPTTRPTSKSGSERTNAGTPTLAPQPTPGHQHQATPTTQSTPTSPPSKQAETVS